MNFNIVRKPKKGEDEEILDEDELDLNDDSDASDANVKEYEAKRKMFKFMGIIVGVTVLLLIILFIASLFSHKSYSYNEIETILKNAAVSYFKDHPENLPQEDGDIVEIDSSNLVAAGKMNDLSEYTKEGVLCSATVQVEKSGSEYLYTPYLNCGDNYITIPLAQKITTDNSVVTSGYGLYSNGGAYVFRGENVNNYVELENSMWRIVKITSNDEIVLISSEGIPYSQPWDDRYNEERFYESGMNTYSASRVKEYLDKVYKNPSHDDGEDILSNSDKAKLVSFDVCTGKRNKTSESKDNSIECREQLKNQKYGLLTLSEFLYISIDPNCKSASTKSCTNYNYLTTDFDWWLATANDEDNSTVFKVDQNGIVTTDNASTYSIVRPVIHLNSRVMYKSGNGTLEKPYKLK